MKIIEALKKIKHLDRKIDKTTTRITAWASYLEDKTATEEENKPQYDAQDIAGMIQQISDWVREKAKLRHRLHKTNLQTTAEFNGKAHTIDELLGLKEMIIPQQIKTLQLLRRKEKPTYGDTKHLRAVLQYDPKKRDEIIEKLEHGLEELDALLDHITIEVDIVE